MRRSDSCWRRIPRGPAITPRARAKKADKAETVIDRPGNIRVDTTLVLIPVTVTNPLGKFVTDLEKENFKLFEDKVEQEILDVFERRRAAVDRHGVRHQRQHGEQAADLAAGGRRSS